ncbi:XRE family transcriptional regulator [Rufibacter quisquiliarum]|uniref:Transcriptional regulator with XRE-family HTH domain n=1 Tax=Rufibacter quisquiliarum TaxID=1549639 RepID=A0A839GTU0_9BACT|nr:XRE family transcriptional regulator [Rufibacter quisquiliarum]MBA9078287.1 transcriptional regulator with XRE-family HTH domain [Rufibacter quisquiliarum]
MAKLRSENPINQRVINYIEEKNISQTALADLLGMSVPGVGKLLRGKNNPDVNHLLKISESYGMSLDYLIRGVDNLDWLIKGEEPMERSSDYVNAEVHEEFVSNGSKRLDEQDIPLYDITAAAGLNALYNSTNNILGYIHIPNMPRCQGAIYVKGDSMYPLIKQGDMVAFQPLMDIPDEIDFGEIYVVDMSTPYRERVVVKYVKKSEKGEEYINLVSYNEKHHPDTHVHLSKVRAMAAVKAIVRLV